MRALIAAGLAALLLGNDDPLPSAQTVKRTWYPSGQLNELRHFSNGHEEGWQQAWTEDGVLYMNYEMRNGRRYGFANARPCAPVKEEP